LKKFFQKFFGPSVKEVWTELSQEIGATYEPGSFLHNAKVILPYHAWRIILDTYTVRTGGKHPHIRTITRIRVPFISTRSLKLTIYPKNIFSDWFPGQKSTVVTDDPDFNTHFIIKGSPEPLVQEILKNDSLRHLLDKNRKYSFSFKIIDREGWLFSKFPENVDLISFEIHKVDYFGAVRNKELLKDMFSLCTHTLDELLRNECTVDEDPHLSL